MEKIEKGKHSVYKLIYRLVIPVNNRKPVLRDDVLRDKLIEKIYELEKKWGETPQLYIRILSMEITSDCLYLTITGTPNTVLYKVVNSLKGVTSRYIGKNFPEIRDELGGNTLWAPSYLIYSTCQVPDGVVCEYMNTISKGDGND